MLRRFRHTTDRSHSAGKIAALVFVFLFLAALLNALAQGDIHPVSGFMAGAIATALAARWLIMRFTPAIARYLESMRSSPAPQLPPPRSQSAACCSRWRRLEAARTGLVVPAAAPRAPGPDGA